MRIHVTLLVVLLLSLALATATVNAQSVADMVATPSPSPVATSPRLSESLLRNLHAVNSPDVVSTEKRTSAYVKLMEAQRYIWRLNNQRTQSARIANLDQARSTLVKALDLDPTLSEAYVALAELIFWTNPIDLGEAAALSEIAVRLNNNSLGGQKMQARVLTRLSGLRSATLNAAVAEKAIGSWKEVARLEPRNAEAWSLLSELYGKTARPNDQIDALRKWMAASPAADIQSYRQVLGGRPDDLQPENAVSRLSTALIKAGRNHEAVDLLSQVLSDDPDNDVAMDLLRQAIEKADPAVAARAFTAVNQIAIANPSNLTLVNYVATLEARLGRVEEGVKRLSEAFSRILATDRPAAAHLKLSIGDIYSSRDRFSEAATEYERALQTRGLEAAKSFNPEEREFAVTVFEKLITLYKRTNKIAEAKLIIARAKKLLGNRDIFADQQLIALNRELGNRQDALAALRMLRSARPDDVALLRNEATLLTEMGQIDRAVELIKQRIASAKYLNPSSTVPVRTDDDFSNYIFISQLYSEAGRGPDAIAAAEQALGIAGNDQRKQIAMLSMASAQHNAGRFVDAESTLREILKKTPGNPFALNNLGYFLLERGERFSEALEMIEQAVATDPTNASYLDSLGWAYFKLGRNEEALTTLHEAARLKPASAAAHEHIGDVLVKMGKLVEARASWQRALQYVTSETDVKRIKAKMESPK